MHFPNARLVPEYPSQKMASLLSLTRTVLFYPDYICIGWPEPSTYTVYDHIIRDFPAKHNVYTLIWW